MSLSPVGEEDLAQRSELNSEETPPDPSDDPNGEDLEDGKYEFTLPAVVLLKIFNNLPVESLLKCRETCSTWNELILVSELLDLKSCFVFDGRKEDADASTKCATYMETSETKNYLWSHLKFRRVGTRHVAWVFNQIELDADFSFTISTLELLNSTLNWANVLQLLMEFVNLEVYMDKQEMYCWDYATFNSGIEEDDSILDTAGFQQLRNQHKLDNLRKLKVVRIHRSQLVECTTYLKMLELRCENLRELEINTDQNFAPQRGTLFYNHLTQVLRKTGNKLRILKFPYKLVGATYDFRTTDEHRLFREFLNFIMDNRWAQTVSLPSLQDLSIQFGIVPIEGQDFNSKLAPFLQTLPSLKRFYCGCIHLEPGMDLVLAEFLSSCEYGCGGGNNIFSGGSVSSYVDVQFGIFMNDAIGVPNISSIQNSLRSLSIQTFRELAKELHELCPLFGIEHFKDLHEFQYFSKNHTFRNFNLDLLIRSFVHLTHLNLVDHNARLETRHSCEALATIEDSDMQLLIRKLSALISLQLIGNMTFLTDFGLTGISSDVCRKMFERKEYGFNPEDRVGLAISHLQGLKSLVLRGLGIKVTDVSALYAFNGLPMLIKLHLYGCHQITADARMNLSHIYSVARGCDMQL